MRLEKKLISALRSGDRNYLEKVFEEIYNTNFKLVHYVLSLYVPKENIEDLVQDTFVSFFNHLDTIEIDGSISSYLTRSAHNFAVNFLKKAKIETSELIEEIVSYQDEDNSLIQLLSSILDKEEMDIIILHVIIGYSLKEIAKEKRKNLNTVKSVYFRAIKKAKAHLKELL